MQRQTISFKNISKICRMSDGNKCWEKIKPEKGIRGGGVGDTCKEAKKKVFLIR